MASGDIFASRLNDDGTVGFPCGPCAAAKTCCMYLWADPDSIAGGPYYPPADLPVQLYYILDGAPPSVISLGSGYTYSAGGDNYFMRTTAPGPSGLTWDGNLGTQSFTAQPCAIGILFDLGHNLVVQDMFNCAYNLANGTAPADHYTVTGGDTLTRDTEPTDTTPGGCTWSGTDTEGGVWTLVYGMLEAYKWAIMDGSFNIYIKASSGGDNQSSPTQGTGQYSGVAGTVTLS